jgi:hypothetical protein
MLLVRLQDKAQSLRLLEERGFEKEAVEMRREQYRENKEILLSFSQTFDYCPVYFFYASQSEAIREGNLSGKVFYEDLSAVENSKLKEEFFIAEFGETGNLGITGLILLQSNLLPLEEPLPFYQRKYTLFGLINYSKADMVKKYNRRLWYLYGNLENQ